MGPLQYDIVPRVADDLNHSNELAQGFCTYQESQISRFTSA
jgi:hypothetical protein